MDRTSELAAIKILLAVLVAEVATAAGPKAAQKLEQIKKHTAFTVRTSVAADGTSINQDEVVAYLSEVFAVIGPSKAPPNPKKAH